MVSAGLYTYICIKDTETMNRNNRYCVIMAGGAGTRFWPVSKTAKTKQFLDVAQTG